MVGVAAESCAPLFGDDESREVGYFESVENDPANSGGTKNRLRFFRRLIVYRAWQSSIVGDAVGHPVHDTTIWVVGAETEADPRYVVLASLTHIHCG